MNEFSCDEITCLGCFNSCLDLGSLLGCLSPKTLASQVLTSTVGSQYFLGVYLFMMCVHCEIIKPLLACCLPPLVRWRLVLVMAYFLGFFACNNSNSSQPASGQQHRSRQPAAKEPAPSTQGDQQGLVKKQKGNMVLYGANTGTGGVKSTNCVKIARYPRLVSYNSEANVRIVKKAKPRRQLCQNSKFLSLLG
jgi:lipopolysaccharide export LptBFGC system permease protein LptF